MEEFKSVLIRCLTSLGVAPELFEDCIPLISSAFFNVLRLNEPKNCSKLLLPTNDDELKWIFLPSMNIIKNNIYFHPFFEFSNDKFYELQQYLVSMLFYQTSFVHNKLMKDNHDVFAQRNGVHKMDDFFLIHSLYSCPNNFYFTTKQFIQLLNALDIESLFIRSIISSLNHLHFDIFDWLHFQYINAQNTEYPDNASLKYTFYCIHVIFDEFRACPEGKTFILRFYMVLLSEINKSSFSEKQQINKGPLMRLLKNTLSFFAAIEFKDVYKNLSNQEMQRLFYNLSVWLFFHFNVKLNVKRKDKENKINWKLIEYAFILFKELVAMNHEFGFNQFYNLQSITSNLSRSISKILNNVKDDTDLKTYFCRFFDFDSFSNDDDLFYCQVLLILKSTFFA